ncbi:MAG: dimethyl sulfoxide reductase anchor subunit [Proteobacteria bacterium]|nr:dimethyl sulfoxide reductase anchor subunit [Pseudomonadota bacterium]MBI3497569.1 dimethyl sulfoxide reductase anchor subunit [Pseudomonadota bacterium]
MHPAFSIILFTTASGAGYGLLVWLGVAALVGLLPPDRWFGAAAFGAALALVTAGLLSSTLHLGHPERAWRAVSQWRSSWLSREGVAALATYPAAGLFAFGWVVLGVLDGAWTLLALLSILLSLATIASTAMIYRSLRTIQRWHNKWVVPVYLALGLMTGALLLHALAHVFGLVHPAIGWIAVVTLILGWTLKAQYWRFIDTSRAASTPESATGLGSLGKVRLLASPHTGENYLMSEMGFVIARKHAEKLRRIATIVGFLLPLGFALASLTGPAWLTGTEAVLAAATALLGTLVERWLFFAEAKHTVTLYYGSELA